MINIYRTSFGGGTNYDPQICEFHGRNWVKKEEVEFVKRGIGDFARPAKKGNWAFGGSFLFTSDGNFSEYNKPIPLHDWNLDLDTQTGD